MDEKTGRRKDGQKDRQMDRWTDGNLKIDPKWQFFRLKWKCLYIFHLKIQFIPTKPNSYKPDTTEVEFCCKIVHSAEEFVCSSAFWFYTPACYCKTNFSYWFNTKSRWNDSQYGTVEVFLCVSIRHAYVW
jgi:hypothetical protein